MRTLENDTLIPTVNPEGVAYSLRPAGIVPRALAYLTDSVIVIIIIGAAALLLLLWDATPGTWLYLLIVFTVQWFYHVVWEVLGRGASPGKKLFGIRVVADDGSPVSPGASIIRNLLRFADTFMGLTIIGIFILMFSPGFRRLGDWGGSTLVVYSRYRDRRILPGNTGRQVRSRKPDQALTGDEKAAIIAFSRRYDTLGSARADEIATELAAVLTAAPETGTPPGEYLLEIGTGLSGEGGEG